MSDMSFHPVPLFHVFRALAFAPLMLAAVVLPAMPAHAMEPITIMLNDDTEVDIRDFIADGDEMLLGFACDQGGGSNEEKTASRLAQDGIETWMPDMLSAYMLPKLPSAIKSISGDDIVKIIENARKKTGKKVYLIAGGDAAAVALNGAARWKQKYGADRSSEQTGLGGIIMMFPRLNAKPPEPGKPPVYIDAVGKTDVPILVLEGERTPNRWGLPLLKKKLEAGGSRVITLIIPAVRGYFYNREDSNLAEDVVTAQLAGVIKASLYTLTHYRDGVLIP